MPLEVLPPWRLRIPDLKSSFWEHGFLFPLGWGHKPFGLEEWRSGGVLI